MRVVVIGGGILGASVAWALAGRGVEDITLLEKEPEVGRHQTGRNSQVLHAGIYYPPGSLKATLTLRGRALLQAYCAERGIPVLECGKVIVARFPREEALLADLLERGRANGVADLGLLDQAGLAAVEPEVRGTAALHSPHTAVVDYGAVTRSLAADLRTVGVTVKLACEAVSVQRRAAEQLVTTASGERLAADQVVICAGLQADRFRDATSARDEQIVPFRGEYYRLRPHARRMVNGLVYPLPHPTYPFVGIHAGPLADGNVLIGPNAVMALAREGYDWKTVDPASIRQSLAWPGTRSLIRRNLRMGGAELGRSLSRHAFVQAARVYLPRLRASDVEPGIARAGIRPQWLNREGGLIEDFRVDVAPGVLQMVNAPSPAATAAFALGEHIADLAVDRRS
jgi:L-2-hydroxyglutarate oxidase LhgO